MKCDYIIKAGRSDYSVTFKRVGARSFPTARAAVARAKALAKRAGRDAEYIVQKRCGGKKKTVKSCINFSSGVSCANEYGRRYR